MNGVGLYLIAWLLILDLREVDSLSSYEDLVYGALWYKDECHMSMIPYW